MVWPAAARRENGERWDGLSAVSMRWGRGFFRVWLVLSLLWIGPCLYGFKPATYSWLLKAPVCTVSIGNNGRQVTIDTSSGHDELASDLLEALARRSLLLR